MKYRFPLCFLTLLIFSFSAQAQVQRINTIAGNGAEGFSGDGHSAFAAALFGPIGVAVDSAGNVYIDDYYNHRVRRVSAATGIITTVAGNGEEGYSGDNSYGASAQVSPTGIAVDKKGNVFISDAGHGVVRKLNMVDGIITTVVGNGSWGHGGDSGSATAASLRENLGLAFDNKGNLYIADAGNHVVRKVDTAGIITTVAGDDTAGYSGDGAAATAAKLDSPIAVTVDSSGALYITDFYNNVIRRVDTGIISTYAGDNALPPGNSGNGGPAPAAQLNFPQGIATDNYGNLYISDAGNNIIRRVDANGIITTVVGNGTAGFGGDLGYVDGANLFNPYGIAVDYKGHIFIADANNERVRETYYLSEGVKNVAQNAAIDVHPNPFINEVGVTGLSKSDRVGVYDVAGRQMGDMFTVAQDGTNTFTINGLAAGIYMLQVWSSDGVQKAVVKMVKE